MIWCVEDDAGIREIETYALQSTGFQARGFEDGAAFQEALKSQLPELIILDVMLPGKDGVTLLRELRAAPATRDIPVIMATARGAEYDKIQSLDLGADDYLVKPFGVMEMVSRVRAVLRRCDPERRGRSPWSGGRWSSARTPAPSRWRGPRSPSPIRSLSCCSGSSPGPASCLPGTACSQKSGALILPGRPGQWMSISAP